MLRKKLDACPQRSAKLSISIPPPHLTSWVSQRKPPISAALAVFTDIYRLWDTIKHHEESVPIAQLAEDHHRRHGKPLRIAVDESDWRFNNLTPQQVHTIRESKYCAPHCLATLTGPASNEQAFQGIEKAMFYRICRLLTLNIQLIVVFDGPGRPWKRGKRGGSKIDHENQRLLKEMLEHFGIPYHEAPGEAEAECARLQILGMVDAVWSQDSDCLMFGCELWIRDDRVAKEKGNTDQSKENTKKNGKFARVVIARDMKEKYGLDREGLVLFAMLAGGDYDEKGLPQCGSSTALAAVKKGLGQSLCACRSQRDCDTWSVDLASFLLTAPDARSIIVPPDFPEYKTLVKYHKPKVSADEVLLNSSRLNLDYVRPIDELKLLKVTSERFNIWGRLYMNWVGPVLLTRWMTSRDPSLPKELVHDIKLTKRRVKKAENQLPARSLERKLTFSPFGVTNLKRADFEGDRLDYWNGDRKVLLDLVHRVEWEMPNYWLEKTLPADVLDPPPPAPKPRAIPKRKRQADDAEQNTGASTTTKRKRKTKAIDSSATKALSTARLRGPLRPTLPSSASATLSRPRKAGPLSATTHEILDFIELSDSENDDALPLPPSMRYQEPQSVRSTTSYVVDLGSPEPSDEENDLPILSQQGSIAPPSRLYQILPVTHFDMVDANDEDLQLALRLSMQEQTAPCSSSWRRSKHKSIFAMREAGRDVHGLSVPAWSLDHTTSLVTSSPMTRAALREVPTVTSHRPGRSARVTLPGVIGVDPASISDRSSTIPATLLATMIVHASTASDIVHSESDVPSSSKPTAAEIRAARLRHFAATSTVTTTLNENVFKSLSTPLAARLTEPASSRYQIPAGADCIDLTND
jgi:Holliday junction resolvase YEN1